MDEKIKINFFKNLLLNLKKNSKNTKEFEILVKVLACSIWADGIVKDEELKKLDEIIENVDKKQKELLKDLVLQKLNIYAKENWVYFQDRDESIGFILKNKQWDYAEYMMEIFKADHMVSEEERELAKHLSNLLESKKYFENKLGIKF